MPWKAVFEEGEFPSRRNIEYLSLIAVSGHFLSVAMRRIGAEQEMVYVTDAVVFQLYLWWCGMPS